MPLHQLLRQSRLVAIAVLVLAALSLYASNRTSAQDPPQPPQAKPTPTPKDRPKDQKEKKGSQRQSSQADQQTVDPDSTITLDTNLVSLDVTVIDQANLPVYDLKKED